MSTFTGIAIYRAVVRPLWNELLDEYDVWKRLGEPHTQDSDVAWPPSHLLPSGWEVQRMALFPNRAD